MKPSTLNPNTYPYSFTLAIDDSDTPWGGCTTHLAALLLTGPLKERVLLADYPLLVRLNPVIPWKTRGNASIVIRGYSRVPLGELVEIIVNAQREYSPVRAPGKAPGLALYPGVNPWRVPQLRYLYRRALADFIDRSVALRLAWKTGVRIVGGPGIVGAVASLAALAPWDPYTYELIAYRRWENIGKPRCIRGTPEDEAGIPACGSLNVDLYDGRIASAPGGPDPILAGFRGREPWCLSKYSEFLCEEPWGWVLYRSNQHTGVHLYSVGPPRPYRMIRLKGVVRGLPRLLPKGHVLVEVDTGWGTLTVAFYRETGPLRDAARLLEPGDMVVVEGGVAPRAEGPTISAESLLVQRVSGRTVLVAPRCPRCGARMKSMGRNKGYKCVKCGYRDENARPVRLRVPRILKPGRYTSSVSGGRHLTRFNWLEPFRGPPTTPLNIECVVSLGSSPPPLSKPSPKC